MSIKYYFYLPILLVTFLSACNKNVTDSKTPCSEILDSLKTDSSAVYLQLPEKNLVIYEGAPIDWENEVDYLHNLSVLNTTTGTIDTIKCGGNDYITDILKGKTEETIGVITCGGSGGYCFISVIDINEKKEIQCNEIETNFFRFEEYIPEGYKGTCFIRTYDEKYGIGYNTAIDFEGNTLFMDEAE